MKKNTRWCQSNWQIITTKNKQGVSPDFAFVSCFQYIGKNDCDTVFKLHDITYHTASQGPPFTAFKNHVTPEKLRGVKYIGSYKNDTAFKNFIFLISEYLIEDGVKKKLHLAHFVAILCDGSTENSIT